MAAVEQMMQQMQEQMRRSDEQIQGLLLQNNELNVRLQQAENFQKGAGKGFGGQQNTGTRLGIDARQLGRPDKFDSSDAKFKDWSIVFRSYASLANSEIPVVMKAAEMGEPVRNA